MKAELILVGKTTDKLFATGIADYADRITHYLSFSINTIPALKNTKNLSEEEQKKAEGELILRQLQPSDTVVLLDEHGAERTSMETAAWLQKKMQNLPPLLKMTARRLTVARISGQRTKASSSWTLRPRLLLILSRTSRTTMLFRASSSASKATP